MKKNILITGGAGFIGSHVVRLFVNKYPSYQIINMDSLTYAGNLANLNDIKDKDNYTFVKCDICDFDAVKNVFETYKIDNVIHLAAESHVDRSIKDPFSFAQTNVMGTLSLLQAAKFYWNGDFKNKLFYHVSTDEVYGSLGEEGFFTESTSYDPHSPYSASKASSDHFVRSFQDTYQFPTVISNCSNNYGSYQFPEKLIPLFINNIVKNKPLPVYGKGENVRDWLFVDDHARAIDVIFHDGRLGETYNIGGFNEWKNIDLIKVIIKTVDKYLGREEGASEKLITYVKDRAGHDLRYAIDSTKLKDELGWEPSLQFEEGIDKTVKWYLDNADWLENVNSGAYSNIEIISSDLGGAINVLIYGAGDSGIIAYKALNKEIEHNFKVIGFIDDNRNKINKKIDRVPIHSLDKINEEFISNNDVDEVIISIQNIKLNKLLEIIDYFSTFKIRVKIVPQLTKWRDGSLDTHQIQEVNIEDLLERPTISIDETAFRIAADSSKKVILITGAAGSIGSEITRQLCKYKIKNLVLIDQAESDLYEIQQELYQKGLTNFTALVADVRDMRRMEFIFKEFNPQQVYHAAAYKHVPLMEDSPYEAVKINVQGTKNIADLSLKYNVERFVMVSTDKAVNPTNVMGATKRVAEMYITCLNEKSTKIKFTITRFGNVLGSNGSVIPIFKKQLENGGPLTVTDKEITRYFMTISEACRLVLEAGTMGKGGEIYVFDMGKSMKIFDVAKKMINLAGYKYPEDIDIKITGLRPGEKLFEELLADGENMTPTHHDKIMIAKTQKLDLVNTLFLIEKLCLENQKIENQKTVNLIKELVPEYISKNSVYEKLDDV